MLVTSNVLPVLSPEVLVGLFLGAFLVLSGSAVNLLISDSSVEG